MVTRASVTYTLSHSITNSQQFFPNNFHSALPLFYNNRTCWLPNSLPGSVQNLQGRSGGGSRSARAADHPPTAEMAPERVAKRFRKLYRGRCARELARYTEADDLANARLRKVMTIYDRWPTLERVELYSTSLARVGIRDKTLGKQALVLKTSEDELAEAL